MVDIHTKRPNKSLYRFLYSFSCLNDYYDWLMSNYILEPYLCKKGYKIELWEKC